MKRAMLGLSVVAVLGCASTPSGPTGPTSFQPVCIPCAMPCTPDSCKPAVVAKPAPKPPPPAPPPSPAEAPTFSPAPGSFTSQQQVTISSPTPGAVVRCTTDGSTPTEASPVCAGPITVDRTTTFNAIAMAPGAPPSSVATGSYSIAPPPPPPPPPPKKLELREKINFGTGNATITRRSYPTLDEVAKTLAANPGVKVRIEGHTDDVGADAANQKLSERRAQAVKTYLARKGVDPARMEAKGFGESNPVEQGKTAKAREANRRVDIYVLE